MEEREGGEPEPRLRDAEDASTSDDDEALAAGRDEDASSDEAAGDAGAGDHGAGDLDTGDHGDDDAGDLDTGAASSDESADEPRAASSASARGAAGASAGSAGARLAAAKAAKAARKAARKSKESAGVPGTPGADTSKESVDALKESSIGQAATRATHWAQTNQSLAIGIFAAFVIAALGWVGYAWWSSSQAQSAGALLEEAVEIANAEIVAADAEDSEDAPSATGDAPAEEEAPTFATRTERSEAALTAYRRVLTEYPSSEAARWARLGEARALFDLGLSEPEQIEAARGSYEQALREAGGDPIVAWRALEGIGFTYEVAGDFAEAIEKYEELRSIDDGAYQAPADYHIARMRIAMGETVQATTTLRELVNTLRTSGEEDEPEFPYVLAQAELRLRELDPGSAAEPTSPMMIGPEGAPGGLPPGLEGIDPAILEQLRRQIQQGAGEGAGAPGEGAPGAGAPGEGE